MKNLTVLLLVVLITSCSTQTTKKEIYNQVQELNDLGNELGLTKNDFHLTVEDENKPLTEEQMLQFKAKIKDLASHKAIEAEKKLGLEKFNEEFQHLLSSGTEKEIAQFKLDNAIYFKENVHTEVH